MIALLRWLVGLVRKEYRLLSRYERSHPHFFWYIGLDALLSVSLVLLGFQVVVAQGVTDPLERLLQHSGAVGMSVDEFIDRVKNDNDVIYWLGSIPETTYTISHSLEYVDVVTYVPKGSNLNDVTQPRLTVETFENSEAYALHVHALIGIDTVKYVTEKGFTIEYDTAVMNAVTVRIKGKVQTIVINYPTKQSVKTILKDVQKLSLVH